MKVCARCESEIQCGAETGAATCWCADMPKLKPIPPQYKDCLCPKCLIQFAETGLRNRSLVSRLSDLFTRLFRA